MDFVEFPKSLYRGEQLPWGEYPEHIIVQSADEEAEARRDGYRFLSDPLPDETSAPESSNSPPKKRGRPRKE